MAEVDQHSLNPARSSQQTLSPADNALMKGCDIVRLLSRDRRCNEGVSPPRAHHKVTTVAETNKLLAQTRLQPCQHSMSHCPTNHSNIETVQAACKIRAHHTKHGMHCCEARAKELGLLKHPWMGAGCHATTGQGILQACATRRATCSLQHTMVATTDTAKRAEPVQTVLQHKQQSKHKPTRLQDSAIATGAKRPAGEWLPTITATRHAKEDSGTPPTPLAPTTGSLDRTLNKFHHMPVQPPVQPSNAEKTPTVELAAWPCDRKLLHCSLMRYQNSQEHTQKDKQHPTR
jgi:hypothetical protein